MQSDQLELSKTYHGLPEVEIASLYAQIDTLTDVAQQALKVEIERRHLSDKQLSSIYSSRLRQESNFDRLERTHRKRVTSFLLFRNDPTGTLVAVIIILVLVLLAFIASHH